MTSSAKTLMAPDVVVTARCIGCGMKRDIGPNEIAPGDHPCCTGCGMPMIAESAQRKDAKRKGCGHGRRE